MREKEAIEILKKVREYYSMNRKGYDAVIKWLEGREQRAKAKRKKLKQEK